MNTAEISMSSALATFDAVRSQLADAACMVLDLCTDQGDTMTTAHITDNQIRTLRTEAARAGDLRQEAICVLAVGGTSALEGSDPGTEQDLLLSVGRTQEWARAECARVIADAAAQE